MNDKLQYASMLEIPVSTCNISIKPQKKRFKKKKVNDQEVKEQLLEKINSQEEFSLKETLPVQDQVDTESDIVKDDDINQTATVSLQSKPKKRFKLKFSAITIQLMVIGLLLATIFITNSVYPNSGINVFMRGIFKPEQVEQVDTRLYSEFAPTFSSNVTINEGVMTVSSNGSVYSSLEGVVTDVVQEEDGRYTVNVEHSANFTSVFSDIEHVYLSVGDNVFTNFPIGYASQDVRMCFLGENGAIISNFQILDGAVVWAV